MITLWDFYVSLHWKQEINVVMEIQSNMKRIMQWALGAFLCSTTVQAQEAAKMAYPQAEWSKAGNILMHTPGQELFNGVIHPAAGLFEDYFDLNKAADEHRGYIKILEENGICVHTVTDILQEVGIDSLRKLGSDVLVYDISNIAHEDAAAMEEYRQNVLKKMSRNDLIRCILLQPTVKLSKTENNTGYEAQYIQNPLMNLYFTRDQSITTPRGHVICRMNSSQRAPETNIIELCYEHLGLKPILRIEGDGRLEGGDYLPAGNVSFIGCGMRTNDEGIRQMMEADAFGHDTVVVVRDHKLWQMQMHLDTYFNILDSDLCTMVRSRLEANPSDPEYGTCDIWARQPGTKEYSLGQRDVPFVEYVRGRGFKIIPIDVDDELHYANNFLTIAPRHIMAVGGQSEELQQRFSDAGVTVEWIPLESLICGYGAAHCMTQVLQRQPYDPTTDIKKVPSPLTTQRWAEVGYHLDGTSATPASRGIIEKGKKVLVSQ